MNLVRRFVSALRRGAEFLLAKEAMQLPKEITVGGLHSLESSESFDMIHLFTARREVQQYVSML
jgi:hypothetical protein